MGETGFGLVWIDYLIIVVYLAITLAIGILAERLASRGADSYFLGGNKLPWWALGASGMASNVDISGTALAVGLVYAMGVSGFFVEIRGGIVLIMAILLAFMGKWIRRSGVMTSAEWMTFRFGDTNEGRYARGISAANEVLFTIWVVAYFTTGLISFMEPLLPGIDPRIAATTLVAFIVIYATAGGFLGVIWTDVFQGILILTAVVYLCILGLSAPALPETFNVSVPVEGGFQVVEKQAAQWMNVVPPQKLDNIGSYAAYNDFWKVIGIFLILTIVAGSSGSGGYMAQRYLAARNEREAGWVALFWTLLLALRWPMVISFAILGIHLGIESGAPIRNPEQVLPTVLAQSLGVGMKGLVVACFLAAFMSTFSSFLNASAAFWSNDLYKVFFDPTASSRSLVLQGRIATVAMVAIGVYLAFGQQNINNTWGWLVGGLGAGMGIPLLLRWYWWRFNGWGFAIGTAFGMAGAFMFPVLAPKVLGRGLADHEMFMVNGSWTFLASLITTLNTAPPPMDVLREFYRRTKPFGFWGPVRAELAAADVAANRRANLMEIASAVLAMPAQLTLFLLPMAIIMKSWNQAAGLAVVLLLLGTALYFTWYRNLSKEA